MASSTGMDITAAVQRLSLEEVHSQLGKNLASANLTGTCSELLFPSRSAPGNAANWRGLVTGMVPLSGRYQLKQFSAIMLRTINDPTLSDGFLQAFGDTNITQTVKSVEVLLGNVSTLSQFLERVVLLVALLTHSKVTVATSQSIANKLYAVARNHLDTFLRLYEEYVLILLDQGFPVASEEDEFPVVTISQLVLPFLELCFQLACRFEDVRFHDGLCTCLSSWPDIFEIWSLSLSPMESSFSIKLATKSWSRVAKIVGVAQGLLQRGEEQSRAIEVSEIGKLATRDWQGPRVDPPGGFEWRPERHDNDKCDIVQIRIIPTMREICCLESPALPGNFLYEENAHWLPSGPQRLLDTHFRILREDMIRGIRKGIQFLLASLDSDVDFMVNGRLKAQNLDTKLFIYRDVTLCKVSCRAL